MNKNQQSLSSIKKGSTKGLKHVLSIPQELIWPIIKDPVSISALESLMKELMPDMKIPRVPMSWQQLRKMTKEERSAVKSEFMSKHINKDGLEKMSLVVLGVNAVTRALEKCNLCSVILDSNVEPTLMIKHVVVMCHNKKIPVILVPFLKTLTVEKLGYASAALGIKMKVDQMEKSHFYKLHQKIDNLSKKSAKTNEKEEKSEVDESISDEKMDEDEILEEEHPPFEFRRRTLVSERAFIPPTSIRNDEDWNEFISLADVGAEEMDEVSEVPKSGRYMDLNSKNPSKKMGKKDKQLLKTLNNPPSYVPLKVKRIQGNPLRTKTTKLSKAKKRQLLKKDKK